MRGEWITRQGWRSGKGNVRVLGRLVGGVGPLARGVESNMPALIILESAAATEMAMAGPGGWHVQHVPRVVVVGVMARHRLEGHGVVELKGISGGH